MKVQMIGVGVVGNAQAYLASKLGHEVLGFDRKGSTSEHYRTVKELEKNADLTFVCTPETVVEEVADKIVQEQINGLMVIKSTVPPKTTRKLMDKHRRHICHNPEFLREKTALHDVLHPDIVIIGECCPDHSRILKEFYRPLKCPIIVTTPTMSELVKLTLNSYLATLISFWNEIDKLTTGAGVPTNELAALVKYNPRVSSYGTEFFGAAFGGKCLPKDLEQTIQFGRSLGLEPTLLEAVREFNQGLEPRED